MPKKITEISLATSLAPADNPTFYVEKGGVFRRVTLAQMNECLNDGITAAPFSAEVAYAAGDYVVHDGQLYRFNADHAAGAWTGTDVSACTMADEMSSVKNALGATLITDEASGAIATFTDGADGVPMESVTVQMEPIQDLHGQDAPYPGGGGKNLCPQTAEIGTAWNGASNNAMARITLPCEPSTQYTLSVNGTNNLDLIVFGFSATLPASSINTANIPQTFTTASDSRYITLGFNKANIAQSDIDALKLQLEKGSTATTFAPYSNICPITGRSEVGVWRGGANLIDDTNWGGYSNEVTLGVGTWYAQAFVSGASEINTRLQFLKEGVWTDIVLGADLADYMTVTPQTADNAGYFGWMYGDRTMTINVLKPTKFRFNLGGMNATRRLSISSTQLSSFASYQPIASITVQLGQTVYGGTVDAVSGVMTVDRAMVDMGSLTWTRDTLGRFWAVISDMEQVTSTALVDVGILSSTFVPSRTVINDQSVDNAIARYTDRIYVVASAYTDAAAFKTAMNGQTLVYPLATPVTVQLDPQTLTSLLGTNNVWSDGGNVSVEYVADTKQYIAKVIAAALA